MLHLVILAGYEGNDIAKKKYITLVREKKMPSRLICEFESNFIMITPCRYFLGYRRFQVMNKLDCVDFSYISFYGIYIELYKMFRHT